MPKAPSRGKTQSPLRIARGTSGRSKARWFSKSRPRRAPRQLRPQDKDPTVHGQRGTSPPFPDSIAGLISEPACFRVKKRRSQRSEASTQTLLSPAGRIRRARVTFSRNLAIAGRKAVPRDAFSDMGQNGRNRATWTYFNTLMTWAFSGSQLSFSYNFGSLCQI